MLTEPMYKPLVRNTGFRLIALQPASILSHPVSCKLLHVDLNNFHPFEALSYVWGTQPDTEPIHVDDGTLQVTTSLATALRHLRLPDAPRLIWADAICIDQNNLDEKSNHVSYMSQVYQRCSRDILWLGENAEALQDAKTAMKFFGSISGVMQQESRSWRNGLTREAMNEFVVTQNKIENLFAKSNVWKRVWIIQELAFAPDILLVAGSATLPWESVEDFLQPEQYIEKYGIPDAFHGPFSHEWSIRTWAGGAIAFPQIMCHQRRVVRAQEKVEGGSMLDVLSRFRYTNSSDPRDKIFALLSLMSNPLPITVDYKLPTRSVYTDCMKRLIEHHGNLDVLVQSAWEMHGNESRSKDLPSWVIDFAEPGDAHILFAQRSLFNAGGNDLALPLTVSDDGELSLSGYRISVMASVSRYDCNNRSVPILHPGARQAFLWMPSPLLLAAIRTTGNQSLLKFLQKNATDEDHCLSNENDFHSSFEAFWRTMTIDVARYPMARLTSSGIEQLMKTSNKWIETLLQDCIDTNLNSTVQENVYEWYHWDFGMTSDGTYCRLPHGTEQGDWIVVLKGAKVPVVLREMPLDSNITASNSVQRFKFIGSCYVHGFMDGEVLEESAGFDQRTFIIT